MSELDIELRAIMDGLTARDGPFATELLDPGGHPPSCHALPIFSHAPPTLPALFAHFCAQYHDREFLIDGDVRLTFGEAHGLARRAAAGLIARHGVRRGDRVGIAAANSANWIIAYMAALMAGGCATLLNGWWTREELGHAAGLAECRLVLADPERAARLAGLEGGPRILAFDAVAGEAGLAPLMGAAAEAAELPALDGDDLATILFTSGSTGLPRAAVSDHRAVVHAALNIAAQATMISTQLANAGRPRAAREAALLCVPLFHATGEVAVLLMSFISGRALVIMRRWDAAEAMRLIEAERVTFFTGVPLMSHEIATHPDRARHDLSSCAYFASGGAPQPSAHVEKIRDSLRDAVPLQGYGLTETNSAGCMNFTDNYLARPESTGPASRPLVEVAILGSEGDVLPPGMVGEVAIRSVCNFRGYWNDAEATAAAIRPDGFFLTGDLGRMDEAGYLFVIDRKKDIIIRGGENIAAVEVERAIYSHPAVAEVSVFGLPDDRFGEVPVAVYHVRPGERLDARELQRHLANRIAAFKIPVQFWKEDAALPRLGAQKLDKRALRDRFARQWAGAKG